MPASRPPAVAGLFYPADAAALRAEVAGLLADAGPERPAIAVVAPHAGYAYAGAVAGAVLGRVRVPATCVVLAPNHTGRLRAAQGGSILLGARYATPIGEVEPDRAFGDALLAEAAPLLEEDAAAHADEHAVEVLVPFLQLRRAGVRLVPIVLAWDDWPRTRRLAEALAAVLRERDDALVVASSDMNHYEPADRTREKDRLALDRLTALDGEGLLATARAHRISMCGRAPAAAACETARLLGGRRGEVVAYAHSGEVNGDTSSVVGYAGVLLGAA